MKNTIVSLIINEEGLYEGDLKYYFKHVFNASNVRAPYHNFRHMMHVTFQVYDAMKYYHYFEEYGKKKARAFLIAAMFHDYNHPGKKRDDHQNIVDAKKGIRDVILPEDQELLGFIEMLIGATEYPHVQIDNSLEVDIIRDADTAQTFSDAWYQQVIFGLSQEMGITPMQCLQHETEFITSIPLTTQWAKDKYSEDKKEKLADIKKLLTFLN